MAVGIEFGLLECAGVGFEGDFDVVGKVRALSQFAEQTGDTCAAKETGGAAADEDAVNGAGVQGVVDIKVRQEVLDVGVFVDALFEAVRVEVAVGAFLHAPRDVDVEGERYCGGLHQVSLSS